MEHNRKVQNGQGSLVISMIKCLLASYLLSGAALLLLALLVYRFELPESIVSIAILIIYAASCLTAGILIGKCAQTRRFLWGLGVGTLYFGILAVMTAAVNHGFRDFGTHFFTTLMICAGSSMLGGMIS